MSVDSINTEIVTVHQKGEDFEITVQHDQSGCRMILSKNAYEQLRKHFIELPTDEEIINNCPYAPSGAREMWMRGAVWIKERILNVDLELVDRWNSRTSEHEDKYKIY